MRIRETFASDRQSEVNNYKKKFFIVSEGAETEPKYFEKLNEFAIKENITIINILRDYAKQGYSNPTHIIKLLKSFMDNSTCEITVEELKNKISNWEHENSGKINLEDTINKLDKIYSNDSYRIQEENLEELFIYLFRNEIYKDIAEKFTKYFNAQDVTYAPQIDSLNMVIDRDKESFSNEQYDEVVKFCKENNVNLYVSNPNFELWLYMHFDEFDNEDSEKLYKNEKVNKSRRYLEKRLHDVCKYKKNYIEFSKFKPGIRNAIKREKKLCEDTKDLKYTLGSNVGILVNQMIKEK